jgi:hypothetical protein
MTKLNKAQLEFLHIFERDIPEEDLMELKKLISRFFAEKAIAIADKVWEEKGYTEDTFLNLHERMPYQNK